MAIIYSYPFKAAALADTVVITDSETVDPKKKTKKTSVSSLRDVILPVDNVTGTGTANKIPMWSDSNTLTDSQFESQASGVLDIPNYIRHIGDTGNFFGFGSTAASSEFLVYTEGSGSPLDQESLRIRPSGTAIKTNATTRLNTTVAGAIELYYAGSKKFETTNTGSTLTGDLSLSDGTNNVTISVPTITTSYDLKMPASIGAVGQVLAIASINGNIALMEWADNSGGGGSSFSGNAASGSPPATAGSPLATGAVV